MSDNLSRLKATYTAWHDTKGDREVWRPLLADRFSLRSVDENSPGLAFARNRYSREEVLDYLAGVLNEWEMVHFTPETFVSEGDQIAMFGLCAYRNRATGKVTETLVSALWRFEDDKAVAMTEIFDSAAVSAAATPDAFMQA
ncbi:nuclear transport factor 2 family protein [Arvimicrobium flavum]|uniref:nuclear transport factor 2 family protein n=1 Tax=Arvimicrobium flavum TaxID=3393320 RepID=UPI00237C3C2D|nr:nuclear transport factor 2 family protein [Mesorhizobium shangrilense]